MDKFVVKQEELSGLHDGLDNSANLLEGMAKIQTSSSSLGKEVNSAMENFFEGLDQRRTTITENTQKLAQYLQTIMDETTNLDNEIASGLQQEEK
ncbi:hypothetical protein EJ419_07460 [Alloscardovia theropitheci]|uniref:Uncharacterized protein n=1 Tax=Alloscardovia theropitheci TaxID=2496842 RepID=A0A4R0QZ12_9BIFI|nr:hypothetical protein [Alloscardovia theropitheci]TCD53796.1 hypothetical protein EJ419_07460 [Alloscardovia theropitheci]